MLALTIQILKGKIVSYEIDLFNEAFLKFKKCNLVHKVKSCRRDLRLIITVLVYIPVTRRETAILNTDQQTYGCYIQSTNILYYYHNKIIRVKKKLVDRASSDEFLYFSTLQVVFDGLQSDAAPWAHHVTSVFSKTNFIFIKGYSLRIGVAEERNQGCRFWNIQKVRFNQNKEFCIRKYMNMDYYLHALFFIFHRLFSLQFFLLKMNSLRHKIVFYQVHIFFVCSVNSQPYTPSQHRSD